MTAPTLTTNIDRTRPVRGALLAAIVSLVCIGTASAQEATADNAASSSNTVLGPSHATTLRKLASLQLGMFQLARMPSVGQRSGSRRALRIHLDGTTDAVRAFGLSASECAPYLHTGAPVHGARSGLSLALNCSFF